MRPKFICKAVVGLMLLSLIAAGTMHISAGETAKKIRIIYTSDMMGYVEPCG